jgi:uncharacterized protein involved in type VI secretion and phage assembly
MVSLRNLLSLPGRRSPSASGTSEQVPRGARQAENVMDARSATKLMSTAGSELRLLQGEHAFRTVQHRIGVSVDLRQDMLAVEARRHELG